MILPQTMALAAGLFVKIVKVAKIVVPLPSNNEKLI